MCVYDARAYCCVHDSELGGMALARLLEGKHCSLKVLDVSWNKLRGRGVIALGKAFKVNKSLRYVSVGV